MLRFPQVLETMVAFRLEVNVIHENVGINACVRSRPWQGAVHQLTRMVSHAVSPSLVSYNTVINSFHSTLSLKLLLLSLESTTW